MWRRRRGGARLWLAAFAALWAAVRCADDAVHAVDVAADGVALPVADEPQHNSAAAPEEDAAAARHVVAAIDAELAELEAAISAQTRRVELLAALRKLATSPDGLTGQRATSVSSQQRSLLTLKTTSCFFLSPAGDDAVTCADVRRAARALGCEEDDAVDDEDDALQHRGRSRRRRRSTKTTQHSPRGGHDDDSEDEHLVERFRVEVPSEKACTALAVLSVRARSPVSGAVENSGPAPRRRGPQRWRRRATPIANLVAVGYDDATVTILDAFGDAVLTIRLASPAVAIACEGGPDDATVAVAVSDGRVAFFDLELARDGRLLAGKLPKKRHRHTTANESSSSSGAAVVDAAEEEDDGAPSTTNSVVLAVERHAATLLGLSAVLTPLSPVLDAFAGATVTALALTSRPPNPERPTSDAAQPPEKKKKKNTGASSPPKKKTVSARHAYVVVGLASGELAIASRVNGTVLRSLRFADAGPVRHVARSTTHVLAAHGSTVSFVSPSSWRASLACVGSRGADAAPVASFAFDAAAPSLLHVGYDDGRALLFRALRGGGGPDASSCRVQHQTTNRGAAADTEGPALVTATARGFLALATPARLVVVNATSARPRPVGAGVDVNATRESLRVAATSPLLASSAAEVLVVVGDGRRVAAYEATARHEPPDRDVAWMRAPIVVVGLVVVFGYQLLKKQQHHHQGRRGGSSFGGGFAGPGDDHYTHHHARRGATGGSRGFDDVDPAAFVEGFEQQMRRSGINNPRGSRLHAD